MVGMSWDSIILSKAIIYHWLRAPSIHSFNIKAEANIEVEAEIGLVCWGTVIKGVL